MKNYNCRQCKIKQVSNYELTPGRNAPIRFSVVVRPSDTSDEQCERLNLGRHDPLAGVKLSAHRKSSHEPPGKRRDSRAFLNLWAETPFSELRHIPSFFFKAY